jgi:hypothetical protein
VKNGSLGTGNQNELLNKKTTLVLKLKGEQDDRKKNDLNLLTSNAYKFCLLENEKR